MGSAQVDAHHITGIVIEFKQDGPRPPDDTPIPASRTKSLSIKIFTSAEIVGALRWVSSMSSARVMEPRSRIKFKAMERL